MIKFYSVKKFSGHILLFFLYTVPNILLRVLCFILWPKGKPNVNKNICIYRVGNIGDLVCTIPLFIAIRDRFPDAKITLLTSPGKKGSIGALETFKNARFFDEVINYYTEEISTYTGILELIKKLRAKKVDIWFYIPKDHDSFLFLLKSIFFAKTCNARWSYGYFLTTNILFSNYQFKRVFFWNEIDRLRTIFENCFNNEPLKFKYEFPCSPADRIKAKEIIKKSKKNSFAIGFVTTAKRPHNEWPLERFESLGNLIKEKYPDAKIFVMGGNESRANARRLRESLGEEIVIDLTGQLSLQVSSELLSFLDILITNNTGPMHMASMQNVHTLGIFSSAEFQGKWYPYGENTKVFINDSISCAGCYYETACNYECISSIDVIDVWSEVNCVLENKKSKEAIIQKI